MLYWCRTCTKVCLILRYILSNNLTSDHVRIRFSISSFLSQSDYCQHSLIVVLNQALPDAMLLRPEFYNRPMFLRQKEFVIPVQDSVPQIETQKVWEARNVCVEIVRRSVQKPSGVSGIKILPDEVSCVLNVHLVQWLLRESWTRQIKDMSEVSV